MIIVTLELTYQMRAEKHILALASVSVAFVKGLVKIDNVAVFSFNIHSSIYISDFLSGLVLKSTINPFHLPFSGKNGVSIYIGTRPMKKIQP
jgi:hypothetical protein